MLIDESELPIEVEGETDGEQLQHVMAAIWIIDRMESNDFTFDQAFQQYKDSTRPTID